MGHDYAWLEVDGLHLVGSAQSGTLWTVGLRSKALYRTQLIRLRRASNKNSRSTGKDTVKWYSCTTWWPHLAKASIPTRIHWNLTGSPYSEDIVSKLLTYYPKSTLYISTICWLSCFPQWIVILRRRIWYQGWANGRWAIYPLSWPQET